MATNKKRYAIVGTGERACVFVDAITLTYRENCELVALCDVSETRMAWHNCRIVANRGGEPVSVYHADNFQTMIQEAKPDAVIVTTIDSAHHHYIIRAMELGCDVIVEKPMATDEKQVAAIRKVIQRTGKDLRVTFNYRYSPIASKVRELVRDGLIGKPQHINFCWTLDTRHGADYFRRWHREKQLSGGLLVHKAAHHFDLINWWIDSQPASVFAMGDLCFYGRENASARGESYDYDRYTGQVDQTGDPFAISLEEDERLRGLYLEAEQDSGYVRDKNVFGDGITMEDTLSVTARYHCGALLSYSLIAYAPREGCQIAITGDRGRIEIGLEGRFGRTFVGCHGVADTVTSLRVFPLFGEPVQTDIAHPTGGHGGADPEMLEQLFAPAPKPDALNQNAEHTDGAASILMGVAANRSIETGKLVSIAELMSESD